MAILTSPPWGKTKTCFHHPEVKATHEVRHPLPDGRDCVRLVCQECADRNTSAKRVNTELGTKMICMSTGSSVDPNDLLITPIELIPERTDVAKNKNEEKEETSEEVLARLARMSETLSAVEAGDLDNLPQLSIVQSHPDITQMFTVNGIEMPGLWVPNYTQFMRKFYDGYCSGSCGNPSPHTGFVCTSQYKPACEDGFAHVATIGLDWDEIEDNDQDMVLEWWQEQETSKKVWFYNETDSRETNTYAHLKVYPFARFYRHHEDKTACGQTSKLGWTCSMPTGHKYSHIAENSERVLQVW